MDFFTKLSSGSQYRLNLEEEFEAYIETPIQRVDSAITYWFNSNILNLLLLSSFCSL